MFSLRVFLYINFLIVICKCFTIPSSSSEQENTDNSNITSRIIFGDRAWIEDYPFFAFLGFCGGAIISDRWILTAGHCVSDERCSKLKVFVGSEDDEDRLEYACSKIIIHPEYTQTPTGAKNDIALVKLTKKLKFSSKVAKIKLPKKFEEGKMVVVGRGTDQFNDMSYSLRKAKYFGFKSEWNCGYGIKALEYICAYRDGFHVGVCYGDSGSPMVRDDYVMGLVSHGLTYNCLDSRFEVFTNVTHYVPWVEEMMNEY